MVLDPEGRDKGFGECLKGFYTMTGLRSYRPIINLKGESSIQLGIDLPGCTYPSEHVCYFDWRWTIRLFLRQLQMIVLGWPVHLCYMC